MSTTTFTNNITLTDADWFNDVDALVYQGVFPASGLVNLTPDADDGAAIGASGTAWSDLFLASGGVINFDAGNVTITHSAGALSIAGALSATGNYNSTAGSIVLAGGNLQVTAGVGSFGSAVSGTTRLILGESTTGVSSLRINHGVAPTAPVDGDIWTTTSGLYVRINGSTVGPLS